MELKKTLSKNSGVIAQIIFAGVCSALPMLAALASGIVEDNWVKLLLSAGLLIVGFLISVLVLHKLNNLSEEVVNDENDYKKRWKLYARLNECQKEHQRIYFYVASLSIVFLLFFLTFVVYYGRDAISIIMYRCWWTIPLYFAAFLIITLYCLWEIYAYKINYYSNDSIQLLWEEIEKLCKKLGIDKEKLKEELTRTGNYEKFEDMILEYGIGFHPKDYIEQTEETSKDIMDTEITIIEQLEATLKEREKKNKGNEGKSNQETDESISIIQ